MAGSAINIKANAQEVINLKRKIDELSSALVSMQRSANPALYDKLNNELQKTTIKYNSLRSEVNQYAKEQERAAKATTQTSDSLTDLLKKGAAIGGITFGVDKVIQLGKEIVNVRGEIQQLEIAFETMLGSKEKADKMMADIKKLALSTPFTLTEVADNTKQIIAMGIASEKAIDTVKMLGDVAAGVSVPLWRVAINYGQVSALGKLQSREIRDFAMAGIPIVEELGKMLGKTSAEIYDMVEAGKIGFPEVEQAFKNMSGEGGKFYNLMEKQNASVTGQISKLKDSIQLMFNEIGESSEGIIYTAIDGASKLVDSYQEVGVILAGLVSTYGLYKAALMTEAAIRPIQIADTYKVQAAALTELLNGEQAYRISQMGLVQGSAEHVAAIQAEIAATAENLKIKLAEEEVNLQSLRTKRAEAEQAWMTAKAKTEAARQELASAISTATAEAEASLQKKMALESEKQSRAALRVVKLQDQKDTAISQAIALKEKGVSDTKIAAKNREIASIQTKIAAARSEEIQHGRNVAAMRAEIKSGVDITANKNVQTLTNKLNTLSEQENAAATAHNGYIKQMVGSKILIKKLSTDADTASTVVNTSVTTANTTATNVLSAAKTRLITVAKNLWAALAPNPYVLAASAVVALGYGIYKLATYQTEAEKAQSRLNETTKEYESNIEGEKVKLDILFGRLKSAKEGTDKYKEAKQGILDIADSYHLSISKDIDLVKEETKYRNILNAAIIETAKAKAIESGTQKATEIYTKTWGDAISDIRERFIKTFGESQGELLLDSLKESLSEGKDLTNEVQDAIGKFSTTYYGSSVTGGGSTTLNPVQQLVTNVQLSKKTLEKEVSDLEGVFGKLKKSTDEDSKKTAKALQDQIFSATKNVQDLKNELKDLQKGIIPDASIEDASFDFAKTIEEKTKSLKEAEDKLSYLLYGKSSSGQSKADKSEESAAEKARKQAQEVSDQNERISQLLDKQGLERRRQNEDLANQEAQAYINSISNAAERIRKQRDHDNKLEIQALERQKEDYIRKIIENEREKFEAQEELNLKQDKKYVKKVFDPSSVKVDTSQYDNILGFNIAAKVNEEIDAANKAWNDYFIEFGTYQEKRKAIIEKYNQEIAQATQDGDKAALENKKQNALDELDNSVKNSAKLMAQLFADSSLKSVGEIQKIIDKAEMLMNYLAAVKDEQGNATIDGKNVSKKDILNLGISESELKKLELSAQEVEALRNAINKLKGDLGGKSPFKQFESQVKDAYDLIKKGGKENIGQGISGIGGAIQGITPELKEFGNSMGQIFGEQTGDDINTIVDLLGNTAQVGQGVGKIMAGDVVGGIKDVVTGIGNIFAMGSEADKRHREALKVINESVKAQEHAYQLALRLKSLEYEKGDTIFGDDPYGKAINAAEEYKDAIEVLKKSLKGDGKLKQSGLFGLFNKVPKTSDYAALQNIDIVTGHKKTGLFGWGKGKDTYTGILTVYPELIDGQGKFNAELAKTILAERKMSETDKKVFQQMIDNAEAIEEAYAVMKDYLTDIFGDLGNSMTDALVNAFEKGEDAAEAFYDSASSMMQKLVKDMINSAVIGPVIQKATEEAMKVMEDTSLSNEQRMDKLMGIVDNALEQGLAASDTAKDLYDYANKTWKDKTGEDLFKPEGSTQSSSRGGFETITQDQAGELSGRFTAFNETGLRQEGHLRLIDENVARIAQWNQPVSEKFNLDSLAMPLGSLSQSSLRIEQMIEENRSISINSYYELKDINKNTKELYQIREDIASLRKDGIKVK